MPISFHNNDDKEPASKSKLLIQMYELQSESFTLLDKATTARSKGDLKSASQSYERLTTIGKNYIKLALLHNKFYSDTAVDIIPIVYPLLQNMLLHSDILQSMNNVKGAEKLRDEVKDICKQHLSLCDLADIERSIALSLIPLGRFNEVLDTLERSRDTFKHEKCNDNIKLAITTIDLASIRQWLGDYNRALSDLLMAEEKMATAVQNKTIDQLKMESLMSAIRLEQVTKNNHQKMEDSEYQELLKNINDNDTFLNKFILIYFYKGLINKYLGNFEEAEFYIKKVIPYFPGPATQFHVASILLGKHNYQECLASTNHLEPAFRADDNLRPKLAALIKIQSECLLKLGRSNEALQKIETAIADLTLNYYDPDILWKLLWLKAQSLENIDDKKKALDAYRQATEIVNDLRKAPLGYRLDSTYLMDKVDLFQSAINLCSKMGLAEDCCNFIEMIKSRILTAILSTPRLTTTNEIQIELKRQFDELTLSLDGLEYEAYKEGKVNKEKQKTLRDEREEIMERIVYSDPRWKTITRPIPFDLPNVIKIITDKKQAVLNLFYVSHSNQEQLDTIIVVLVKEGNCEVAEVTVSTNIKSKLNDYQSNLHSNRPNPKIFDVSTAFSLNAEDLIPSSILSKALTAKELIIIPHRILHLIPWAGLIFKEKRLFEYCPIGILPNLSCILKLGTFTLNKPRVALIGSPEYKDMQDKDQQLFGATREMEKVEEMYSEENNIIGKPLIGQDVTEANFWKLVNHDNSNGGILHITCHGRFESDEPMSSGLFLTDSKVDAAEIARASLKYDEVILSACSTGLRPMEVGKIELVGDDILGLPGSFLEAGVKSVLVSISLASDYAAPKFMKLYHKSRINNNPPLVALQQAQKKMLYNSRYLPFYWIGFTIYGCQ